MAARPDARSKGGPFSYFSVVGELRPPETRTIDTRFIGEMSIWLPLGHSTYQIRFVPLDQSISSILLAQIVRGGSPDLLLGAR